MADGPNWRLSLSLAAVGIVGALLGSTAQHFLTLNRDEEGVEEAKRGVRGFLHALDSHAWRERRRRRASGGSSEAATIRAQAEPRCAGSPSWR